MVHRNAERLLKLVNTLLDFSQLESGKVEPRFEPLDLAAVTAVWSATSEQDWELSERNHLGQCSRAYRPGPLSPITETSVGTFHDWYLSRMRTGA